MSLGDVLVLVVIAAMIVLPLVDTPSVRPFALAAVVAMVVFFAGWWWLNDLMTDWANRAAGR